MDNTKQTITTIKYMKTTIKYMKTTIKYVLQSRPKLLDPVYGSYNSWQDQTIDKSLKRIQILFKIGTGPHDEYQVVKRTITESDEVIQ